MIISILLQVLRFGSFLWLFIQGHVVARMMRPQFPEAPSVLQCADSTGIRRWCKICEIFQDNRVYHCSAVGLCLPVHDHTCRWWGGRIWAANFKANLNFLFWTEIHLLFLSGVGIFAWTQGRIVVRLYAAGILFVPLLICVRLGYIFFTNFWEVVSTNLLWKESNRENIFFTMNTSGRWNDVYRWDVAKLETNPWDLGRVENRRQFFGARRSWLFFWTPTPIMKNGPVFNNRVNPARPIGGEDRTRAIACSGAEETEQETLASMDVIQRR